jgi:predicted nucleotidyltransferase
MRGLRASTDPDISVVARVLAELDTPVRLLGADCMVVGATARNVLSVAWFDRLPSRVSRDVDVAVAVATWEAFDRLTEGLDRRGGRTPSARCPLMITRST